VGPFVSQGQVKVKAKPARSNLYVGLYSNFNLSKSQSCTYAYRCHLPTVYVLI